MTDRKNLKGVILPALLAFLAGVTLFSLFWSYYDGRLAYERMSRLCGLVLREEPEAEQLLLTVLKEYGRGEPAAEAGDFLTRNGYTGKDFAGDGKRFRVTAAVSFLAGGLLFAGFFLIRGRRRRDRIGELTDYLEQVNTNGTGRILQGKEDEFSLLQDEIYKTVTNLYRTREEALRDKRNYADNLANIAHQLKTPCTAAMVSLRLSEEREDLRREQTEKIRRQLRRLNTLEEALLQLSRIDSGTLKLRQTLTDAYTVLMLAADQLQEQAAERHITIRIPEKEAAAWQGDPDWSMEAVFNLMKNSMEHTPEGGEICCDYSRNPLYTEIRITDNGKGFAEEDLPHIFERFYRGKNASGEGIGIGLTLAKAVFELQNGTLTARNLPAGGACFEIRVYGH